MQPRHEQFADLFILCQDRVYAYVVSLLARRADAEEVFQQTSMILWRKWDEFVPGADQAGDFVRWACGIAHFEVMNHLRKAERRVVALDRDVMDLVAAEQLQLHDELSERRAALEHCLGQLPPRQRELLESAYAGVEPIKDIARRLGQTANAAYVALRRIRHAVADCITRRVARGAE